MIRVTFNRPTCVIESTLMHYSAIMMSSVSIFSVISLVLIITDGVESVPRASRGKAVAEAIDQLYGTLPENAKLEDKCKSYALVLTMIASKGQAHKQAAAFIGQLSPRELTLLQQDIGVGYLASLYEDAIDEYRNSKLRPAFIELIECLRLIDPVRKYVNDKELIVITEVYRQILRAPETRIDAEQIGQYYPQFEPSLRNLFGEYLKGESSSSQPKEPLYDLSSINVQDPQQQDHQQSDVPDPCIVVPRRLRLIKLRQEEDCLSLECLKELRLERRREANRERQRRLRKMDPERIREIERQKYERLRKTKPDEVRAHERERQRRRRSRMHYEKMRLQVKQLWGQQDLETDQSARVKPPDAGSE